MTSNFARSQLKRALQSKVFLLFNPETMLWSCPHEALWFHQLFHRPKVIVQGLEEGVGCVVQLAGQGARVAAVEMLGCLTVYEVKSSLSVSKSKCMLMTPSQRQDLSKSARLKRVAADSTGEGPLSAIYVRGEGGWGPWQVLGKPYLQTFFGLRGLLIHKSPSTG